MLIRGSMANGMVKDYLSCLAISESLLGQNGLKWNRRRLLGLLSPWFPPPQQTCHLSWINFKGLPDFSMGILMKKNKQLNNSKQTSHTVHFAKNGEQNQHLSIQVIRTSMENRTSSRLASHKLRRTFLATSHNSSVLSAGNVAFLIHASPWPGFR